MGNSSGSVNVSVILPISLVASCLVLSCVGYILSERTYRKRQQAHIVNEVYEPEIPEQVFTIDIQPSTTDLSLPAHEMMEPEK